MEAPPTSSPGPGSPRCAPGASATATQAFPNEGSRVSDDVAGFVRDKLGHEPRELALFERALTHASASRDSYERLEFLGDRVLGLVVARLIFDRFGSEPEGQMSKRLN